MTDIEWRPIPGYEGRYEVSNDGRVKSYTRGPVGREVSPFLVHGYRRIRLVAADGSKSQHGVHRLVLMAFDRMPIADEQARHLNDEKLDNRIANLSWGSQSDNMLDRVRNGKCPRASKTRCRNGHPWDATNTLTIRPAGLRPYRACRACQNEASLRYHESRRRPRMNCSVCGSLMRDTHLPTHMANVHPSESTAA